MGKMIFCDGGELYVDDGELIVYRGVFYVVTRFRRIGSHTINEFEAEGANYVVDMDLDRYFSHEPRNAAVFYRKDNLQGERSICHGL